MIIPVPWSSVPLPVTSMLTTEGRTFCTNFGMLSPLGSTAGPGRLLTSLIVTPPVLEDAGDAKWPASPPTRAATRRRESRVDHSVRLLRTCET